MDNGAVLGLSLVLACTGCSVFQSVGDDMPEPTRMDVAVSRSIATHALFATELNPPEREAPQFWQAAQWVAPGCPLQLLSLAPHSKVRAPLLALMNEAAGAPSGYSNTNYLNTYRRFVLRSSFGQDQSALPSPLRSDLDWFARALRTNTAVAPHVIVVGHTNPDGSGSYNARLGKARANKAAAYLVASGVPGERIHVVTAGESVPPQAVHPTAVAERSRRIELVTFVPGSVSPEPGPCDRVNDQRLVSVSSGGAL